jgi:hypothetical protein
MKARLAILAASLAAMAVLAPAAQAEFGLTDFESGFFDKDGQPEREAGAHPYEMRTSFQLKTRVDPDLGVVPAASVKIARFYQPAGFIGSRTAVPTCATADFLDVKETGYNHCPDATAVGIVLLKLTPEDRPLPEPVYNLPAPPGVAVKLGFIAFNTPTTVEVGINQAQPYNVIGSTVNIPQTANVYGAELRLWGIPADHAHDPLRGNCLRLVALDVGQEPVSLGNCDTGAAEVPWLTLPRSCTGPLLSTYEAVSWQSPNAKPDEGIAEAPGMTGCSKLNLAADLKAKPTAATAESASGLDFEIEIKDEGLYNPGGPATQSDIKKAVVTLPPGMTVNPSSANGLGVCSPGAYAAETLHSAPGAGCPDASKIGEVEVESPLLAEGETLHGSVFLATQNDNPFKTLIALYMVIKSPQLGVLVKLPLKVEPNEELGPNAGRLVTTLDDAPQIPVSAFRFHFVEGARGPLLTPPACGDYEVEARFSPWSDPSNPVTATAGFEVEAGVAGGPCPPGGVPPFRPGFSAGALNNSAGAYSPFTMRLTRPDGDQGMTRFDATLPRGVLGKLAGLTKCPASAIAVAKAKTGRQEQASPSCPASSEIGTTIAGAGVGSVLTYAPGKIYLGGPVGKAPLSVIAITPAVAGPFDIGTVVLRQALALDPQTAEVRVDGALSDPIPTALRGIVLKVKDVRVYVNRPNFILNPTSCAQKQTQASLFGSFLDLFSPADDRPVALSDRYQAASCASLGFKPKLDFRLKGGTKRGGHPALTATYTPRPGEANVKGLVVRLPRSAFLDQGHIRTICTRVQFAQDACPKGARYGEIKAFTPLLDEPLQGPVYLRSSNNKLPDLVFDLHGLVDVEFSTRIDSIRGGIRATIDSAPDAPVSKVVLRMQGGKKGLIVNSRDLCAAKSRASVQLAAHSGKRHNVKPLMRAQCGGKRK